MRKPIRTDAPEMLGLDLVRHVASTPLRRVLPTRRQLFCEEIG